MRSDVLRIRVQRLLYDTFNSDSLSRVFVDLRERSFGYQSVREVGDFVAHSREREKGPVTETVSDFFALLRFSYETSRLGPIDLQNTPKFYLDAIPASFRRISENRLRRETGLKPNQARPLLKALLSKFKPTDAGTYALKGKLGSRELALARCLTSQWVSQPAFTDAILVDEFWQVLSKNKLVDRGDEAAYEHLIPLLTLFAVTAMHQCTVIMKDQTRAELLAAAFYQPATDIDVIVRGPFETKPGKIVFAATPMFMTRLRVADHCEGSLLQEQIWEFPIEISPDGKLRRMTE